MSSLFAIIIVGIIIYLLFKNVNKTQKQKETNRNNHNIKKGRNYSKWIGGGLGWAFGGPLGAIIGFALGSLFSNNSCGNISSI